MRLISFAALLCLAACGGNLPPVHELGGGNGPGSTPVNGSVVTELPPAHLAKPTITFAGLGGPTCCENGVATSYADCSHGECSCATGEFCTCADEPLTFSCSDFCGSDAYVNATCTPGGWACSSGLVRSDECPAGTCWGDPGGCCVNPSCVDGAWTCESIATGC